MSKENEYNSLENILKSLELKREQAKSLYDRYSKAIENLKEIMDIVENPKNEFEISIPKTENEKNITVDAPIISKKEQRPSAILNVNFPSEGQNKDKVLYLAKIMARPVESGEVGTKWVEIEPNLTVVNASREARRQLLYWERKGVLKSEPVGIGRRKRYSLK